MFLIVFYFRTYTSAIQNPLLELIYFLKVKMEAIEDHPVYKDKFELGLVFISREELNKSS